MTVLIVDDEEDGRNRLKGICEELSVQTPIRILTAGSIAEAIKTIFSTSVHVVLLDKNFENGEEEEDGIEAVPHMRQIQPLLQILIVTASNATQDIVRAIQLGAFGYITKEHSNGVLVEQVRKVVETAQLVMEKARLEASTGNGHEVPFITNSKASKQLDTIIHAVAESDRPVLLLGESGTGKTTIAKLIHGLRKTYLKQSDRPFFNLNLAAMSPSLIERELFGNEAGAFTGAVKMKQGFFELANGGTLFLDEIAEVSLDIQKKLLKVIREGVFQRLGGTRELRTSFKLISATNQNLEEMVAAKTFREDLYYRIATFPVRVPSLRERKQDIPEIIKQLLPTICRQNHVFIKYDDLPKEFVASLRENPPPGNITGLEHKISQLLILSPKDKKGTPILSSWRDIPLLLSAPNAEARTCITIEDFKSLPLDVVGPGFPGSREFLSLVEEKLLEDASVKFKGKNRAIASALKVSEGSISIKVKDLNAKKARGKHLASLNQLSKQLKDMEMLQ